MKAHSLAGALSAAVTFSLLNSDSEALNSDSEAAAAPPAEHSNANATPPSCCSGNPVSNFNGDGWWHACFALRELRGRDTTGEAVDVKAPARDEAQ